MNFIFFINWIGTRWEILKSRSGSLGKNWAWEFNIYATHSLILIDINLRWQGDHRGFFGMVGLLGYALDVNVYDTRHEDNYQDESEILE